MCNYLNHMFLFNGSEDFYPTRNVDYLGHLDCHATFTTKNGCCRIFSIKIIAN